MANASEYSVIENKDRTASGAVQAIDRPLAKTGTSGPNMTKPLYMQASSNKNVVLIPRSKRKQETSWRQLSRWFVENQIGLSFNVLALLFLAHAFIPKARTTTTKFFHLAYYNEKTGQYGAGIDDVYFIVFCIVLFTGLRAGTMEYLLAPLAKSLGIQKRKMRTRFSEQAWLLVYYSFFWTAGVYLYVTSPYYLNLRELWTDWPNREMTALMKGYILGQWAFWLQQIIVIHIEERRKDHWQMLSHHVITVALISSCFSYHFTRVGNLILVLMDVVDIVFPLAKCLKYSGYQTLCDIMFGAFLVSWIGARHIGYNMVCWSVYRHTPEVIGSQCYHGSNDNLSGPHDPPPGYYYLLEPFINSTGNVCFTQPIRWSFLTALLALQGITLVWLTMIMRVAIRVLKGQGSDDPRSDEDESEDEYIYEEAEVVEEDVGVEDIDFENWERRSGHKRQSGTSSGVSLPGHSDRKELLGRIGCEKQVE